MNTRSAPRAGFLLAILASASVAVPCGAQGFARRRVTALGSLLDQRPAPCRTIILNGLVVGPSGAPAAGAEVRSSSGATAVAGSDGRFELELRVPQEADSVQLSAVGATAGAALAATARVDLPAGEGSASVAPLVLGQTPCQASWRSTFGPAPGVASTVLSALVFDDGSGSALYLGMRPVFSNGMDSTYVMRWDGTSVSTYGDELMLAVTALAHFDDGSGEALYIAGGVDSDQVARWDGSDWVPLGGGMNDTVVALATFDDGGGPALYAGGYFHRAGGVDANGIARWNGTSWSPLGEGLGGTVLALTTFDDGSGPALFAAGVFTTAGGAPANRVARWDGSSWSPLGTGMNNIVRALAVHYDGSGPALYAGGTFTSAGGSPANRIARWDGTSWSSLGSGMPTDVRALASFDQGGGAALLAAGDFAQAGGVAAQRIARWDGSSWSSLGDGVPDPVWSMAVYDGGGGAELFVGGEFTGHVQRWDGSAWFALGNGVSDLVYEVEVFDDGSGPALYAVGEFRFAGHGEKDHIAKWDGASWSPLGEGLSHYAQSLVVFDDGTGPALYVGGGFLQAGGLSARHIARWDGVSWSSLGIGPGNGLGGGSPAVLTVFDDGSGPALYAGGAFDSASGLPTRWIARWDGSSWSALGSGVNSLVAALQVFDDGSGPALYVGGEFTLAGGLPTRGIARWNGSNWSSVGGGLSFGGNTAVGSSLEVFDDGGGPALYLGGAFDHAGGVPAGWIARWNGSTWSALGAGMNSWVHALKVHDDGSGPALFAGGEFTSAGGLAANRIARWDGALWSNVGSGATRLVSDFAIHDDGSGATLFAGVWGGIPDSGDAFLGKWGLDVVRLDFETEDDFETPLANGQDLSSPPEFARLLSISSSGPNAGAAIFDSTPGGPNDPSQDPDLLVGRGKVLILQTDQNTTQTVPGRFDRPNDDSDGGTLRFDFHEPVCPHAVTLVDIDAGNSEASLVVLTDRADHQRIYLVPPRWTGDLLLGEPGRKTLDLHTLDPQPGFASTATAGEDAGFDPEHVVRLAIELGSSGAVDDLAWHAAPVKARRERLHRRR